MSLLKLCSRIRIRRLIDFQKSNRNNYCTIIGFLNPNEIGNLNLKFDDRRISNLLSRYRDRFKNAQEKKISLSEDYSDFCARLISIENQIADIDRQIEELRNSFSDFDQNQSTDQSFLKESTLELATTDSELAKLIDEDRRNLIGDRHRLEKILLSELAVWLIGKRDKSSESEETMPRDLILEVSSGVGGQEAMLFTKEIFDMYHRYAQFREWKFDILEEQATDINGLHFAVASISGADAYARLRFEGGVHRVQRVPATERTGRVHTSTMSVAILAQAPANETKEKVNWKEFRFETFRACAPGGQNVNKSESGSRITHIPTGTTVSCQMERQAQINRDWALRRLLAILYDRRADKQRNVVEQSRKLQVGSLGRSEKIRTYNYTQDRITDHRTKHSFGGIPETLAGGEGLERIVHSMLRFNLEERLSEALDEEEKESAGEESLRKVG